MQQQIGLHDCVLQYVHLQERCLIRLIIFKSPPRVRPYPSIERIGVRIHVEKPPLILLTPVCTA